MDFICVNDYFTRKNTVVASDVSQALLCCGIQDGIIMVINADLKAKFNHHSVGIVCICDNTLQNQAEGGNYGAQQKLLSVVKKVFFKMISSLAIMLR